jgi:hypothetical protein
MDFIHSAPSVVSKAESAKAEPPSFQDLKALFVASAIPMVGFGASE